MRPLRAYLDGSVAYPEWLRMQAENERFLFCVTMVKKRIKMTILSILFEKNSFMLI